MQEREVVIADGLAVDANAFVDAHQVRRRVQPGPQPGSTQNRCQRGGSRALAVSARYQYPGNTPLGMFQPGQQHPHVRQVELASRRLRQLVTERVDACNGGFVGHGKSYQPSAVSFQLSSFQFQISSYQRIAARVTPGMSNCQTAPSWIRLKADIAESYYAAGIIKSSALEM